MVDANPEKPVAISFIGKSGSGKTTLLEKLIAILARKGYRIGTLKHVSKPFTIDYPGKDTFRHRMAGSDTVMIASPGELAMIRTMTAQLPVLEIVRTYFQQCDVVLVEGYKLEGLPKIEVVHADNPGLVSQPAQNLIATVAVVPPGLPLPNFAPDDAEALSVWLEHEFNLNPSNRRTDRDAETA